MGIHLKGQVHSDGMCLIRKKQNLPEEEYYV